MAKGKKPLDEEKQFCADCKLFFSFLTARATQWAYFNIAPNVIVLCNSTSGTPNETHGDKIMDYSVGELSFHFVEFKSKDFVDKVREILQIPDNVYYAVHILNVLSLFNKFKLKDLEVYENEYSEKILINKGRTTYEKKNIVGFPLVNFHIVGELAKWYRYTYTVGTPEHQERYPFVIQSVDTRPQLYGRVFYQEIETDKFIDKHGARVFQDVLPMMKILCLDGLTCPSVREFYKRVADEPHTFQLYLWAVDRSYVLSMTTFENDMVVIRSIRPNILSIPVSSNIVIENKLKTEISEEIDE